jgi:hypothetical protein
MYNTKANLEKEDGHPVISRENPPPPTEQFKLAHYRPTARNPQQDEKMGLMLPVTRVDATLTATDPSQTYEPA